ncbi:inactive tyrosine-protein kinase 7-like isoform X1 [Cataglyphis hispanica]|uniref:inactive tyrosine-protein kinase 7-like isoform X1 n=1 Tax=Cataglyphis hispanica TaxID=1086592 RepID=UPI00217F66C8|nr:inactive tyrosine-protein kinase 7-like isoform X1 [Cataglyphis hispanica]
MVPFHGMVLLLLGIGYLLHAEPLYGERGIAFLHLNNDTFGKGEKSQRGTKKTYFFKDSPQKLTVARGQAAVLFCRIKNLGNRTVSWIRKRDLHILTSMFATYTSDARFTVVSNPETDDWNLRIDYVQPRDAGIYECQVNTEPKIYRAVTLKVLDIQAKITGPQELYIKKGSTISLTCIIELQDLPPSNVTWYHAGAVIDFDGPRGGVSLETEKGKRGTTSKLLITRAQFNDSGNYTCASSKVTPASVMVHVLNGEQNIAAVAISVAGGWQGGREEDLRQLISKFSFSERAKRNVAKLFPEHFAIRRIFVLLKSPASLSSLS